MRAAILRQLAPGTVVRVTWLDICEDQKGDPRESGVVRRRTVGSVWGVKRSKGADVFTLTFTTDEDGPHEQGWLCIPTAVVQSAETISAPNEEGS